MIIAAVASLLALPALAAELIMVEQHGCYYCELWDEQISEIYPKTAEGALAPLRRIDIHQDTPSDLNFSTTLHFTPTFVLVEDGQELARIEGYPGEEFFWWLLSEMMREKLGFEGQS
ncbi:MAG: hypothetical protein V3U96_09130 [Paracoccaceae bacterium]